MNEDSKHYYCDEGTDDDPTPVHRCNQNAVPNHPAPVILDDAALAEIEVRANAATEGPWEESSLTKGYLWGGGRKDTIANFGYHDGGYGNWRREYDNAKANLEFVKYARTDIPALCQTVRALRAQVEKQDAIISAYENNDEEALAEAENL